MNILITPQKQIEKMSKHELIIFVNSFAPHKFFYPRLVKGARNQAKKLYQDYLNNKTK